MKRLLQIAALALVVTLGGSFRNTASAQMNVDISYQTFYDELSPYGEWVDYPEYGYVWVPAESDGFQPYETNGHWVWSDEYEWTWVSDYSWGWAPFHYGRWFSDPSYGWMWMPGYEWSPAWVAWRDGGDYYGWAPLRPGFNIGINISLGNYNPPMDYWCFAPRQYISSPRIYDYCLDRGRNVTIFNNTIIINNYGRRNNVFFNGPRRNDAERYAGRINPVRFRDASGPGRSQFRNNEVSVYRPGVRRDDNRQFRPGAFERYDRNRGGSNGIVRNRDNNFSRGNSNNLPVRGNRNDNAVDRRDNNDRRRGDNNDNSRNTERRREFSRPNEQQTENNRNGNTDRGRYNFDRNNNNNNDQPVNNDRRVRRSFDRPEQQPQQTNPSQPDNRNEQRRNDFSRNRDNNNSQSPQVERPQQSQPRQFENRSQRQQPSPQLERPQQSQPRQFENRSQRQQPSPQVERPQPSQPRQFENRENNQQQRGGNGNNGRGRRG